MPGEQEERVLVLVPSGRDGALAQQVLARAGLAVVVCPDVDALCAELAGGAGALLIGEEALADFPRLAQALHEQPPWSDVPLLVVLGPGEITRARLPLLRMMETLRNATYLERPVRMVTLISTARAALAARRRQYEVRDHLRERERVAAALEEANRRLQEADQRKDQFLALLGHELRNPLAAISNGVRMIAQARAAAGDARLAHACAVIDRQTRHLTRLVDDLLDVSRLSAGKIVLRRQALDLGELIERAGQAVAESAGARSHALSVRPPGEPVWVDGDPVRLEQVVVNLLANAIKYTPAGGTIELWAAGADGQAVIGVRDNGAGIAPEVLPHVFALFSQGPQTLDRAQGGLGIGLTVVRSLVELHGGEVQARSAGPGQGSEFVVRLPLSAAPAPGPAAPGEAPAPGPAVPRHIVVVEDNPDIRETLQELLEELGHQVEAVADGTEGIERILRVRPEVALVDIGLPGVDGYEVARRVRAEAREQILLVAMTGYGQPEDHRRSLAAGFDAHLTKPPEMAALQALIAGIRGRSPAT